MALTSTCQEAIKSQTALQEARYEPVQHYDFITGFSSNFDKNYALDTVLFWQFLHSTQPHELKDKLDTFAVYEDHEVEEFSKLYFKGEDDLDDIIRTFNEHWFQGWSATPEEQRVKLINIAKSIQEHPDFEDKYQNEIDPYNRQLVFELMCSQLCFNVDVMNWSCINFLHETLLLNHLGQS